MSPLSKFDWNKNTDVNIENYKRYIDRELFNLDLYSEALTCNE